MDSTITDPETPAEEELVESEESEPEEVPEDVVEALQLGDNIELMAEGDVTAEEIRTISFSDFTNVRQKVKIQATVGSQDIKTVRTEAIAVKKTDAVVLTLEGLGNYVIESVKNGTGEDAAAISGSEGRYTIPAGTDNMTVVINTAETYTVYLEDDENAGTGQTITLDDSLKDAVEGTGANKLNVTTDASVKVKDATSEKLVFTLTGDAASGKKTIVSYKPNHKSEDNHYTVIDPEEVTVPGADGAASTTKITYTVEASVLADLDGEITIKLSAESAQKVTLAGDAAGDTPTVDVKLFDSAATGDDKFTKAFAAGGEDVFVGDSLQFKVAMKEEADKNLTVAKVEKVVTSADDEETADTLEKDADGIYTIEVTEEDKDASSIAIKVTTDFVAEHVKVLKFVLEDSDEGSATASITKIVTSTPGEDGANPTEKVYTTSGESTIASYLGNGVSADLTAGEEFKLADNGTEAVTKVEVTVAPADNTYELKTAADEELEDGARVYKYTTGTPATGETAFSDGVTEIVASTETVAQENETYFKIAEITPDEGAEAHVKTDLDTVAVAAESEAETWEIKKTGTAGVYQVNADQSLVTFHIIADEGWELNDANLTMNGFGSISEGELGTDGKTTYEVNLRAIKLGTNNDGSGADLGALAEKAKTFTAKIVDPEDFSGFRIETFEATEPAVEDAEPNTVTINTGNETFAYGSKLDLKLVANGDRTFTSVTYTMEGSADGAAVIRNEMIYGELVNTATLSIPKVTGNVEVTVAVNELGYALKDLADLDGDSLKEYYDDAYVSEDDRYIVSHEGSYIVGVTKDGEDVPAGDLTAVIMDGQTRVRQNKIPVDGGLRIDLANKNLAGKDITVTMSVKGEVVGTYTLTVVSETTTITVKGAEDNVITQRVDSTAKYEIETDGTVAYEVDYSGSLINDAYVYNNTLFVTTNPVAKADTLEGDKAKEVILTLHADDNEDTEQEVKVTVTPFFDATKAPVVTPVVAADTVINVNVDPGEVLTADYEDLSSGKLWYEITATAEDSKGEGADAVAFSTVNTILQKQVVKVVALNDASQRVPLQVGLSSNLGEGTDWPYKVTARLVYVPNKTRYSGRTTPFTNDEVVEASAASDADAGAIATQKPTFTAALKLTKGKATTLYTGQNTSNTDAADLVIAKPTFKDKGFTANYQVIESNIEDTSDPDGYDLSFGINAAGEIVVTDVSDTAMIGKHVIKVTATADETTGHLMYASTATITVNVVKGVSQITVGTPSRNIFKDTEARKPAAVTLKPSITFNEEYESYDAKGKIVTAPKSKTVTWSIVSADSREEDYYEDGYVSDKVGFSTTDKNNGVTINAKNGTITVGKNFVPSSHTEDNQFRIMAQVSNKAFPGNKTYGLSPIITITKNKTDIGKLVIAKYSRQAQTYTVLAVQDVSSKKAMSAAIEVSATDIDGSRIYAVPADASIKAPGETYYVPEWNKLPTANTSNLTIASTSKKVLDVSGSGYINVLAAGKKAGIKVTANDGSKATNTLNLNLGFTGISAEKTLALDIYTATGQYWDDYEDEWIWDYPEEPGTGKTNIGTAGQDTPVDITNTTGAARLWIDVKVRGENGFELADPFTNCAIKVSGGKVVWKTNTQAEIISSAKTTKITLTDTYKDANNKNKKAVYTYTLTNKAYDFERTVKAPKVKVTGSLHSYGTVEEQNASVKLNVLDATTKAVPTSKAVKVEIDWSAMTAKNKLALNMIDEMIHSGNNLAPKIFTLDNDGNMNLTFSEYIDDNTLPKGSYKLKVTVVNGSGVFQGPPASAVLKVTQNKKFTFKPTTSYTIGRLDGAAMLTGKSNVNAKINERADVMWGQLYNVNVGGSSNNFTKFFELQYDSATKKTSLVATPLLWAAKDGKAGETIKIDNVDVVVPTLNEKTDLTGYVHYVARPSVGYYDPNHYESSYVSGDAKITVKLAKEGKTGSKYAANTPEVKAATAGEKTAINIMVGNEFVKVAYAAIDTDPRAKTAEELELVNDTTKKLTGVNETGQVMIQVKSGKQLENKKSYSASLRIIPANSYYKAEIEKALNGTGGTTQTQAEGDADTGTTTPAPAPTAADLIQQNGIAIRVTVKGATEPKVTTPDPVVEREEPTPGVKDPIPTAVVEAVSNAAGIEVNASDVTITDGATTGAISAEAATALAGKIKTAVSAAADYELSVATTLTDVTAIDDSDDKTAKASVIISRDGYENATAEVTVTIKAAGSDDDQDTTPATIEIYEEEALSTKIESTKTVTAAGELPLYAKVLNSSQDTIADATVTWEIVKNNDQDTIASTVGTDGKVTINASDSGKSFKVKATSGSAFVEITITVNISQESGDGDDSE